MLPHRGNTGVAHYQREGISRFTQPQGRHSDRKMVNQSARLIPGCRSLSRASHQVMYKHSKRVTSTPRIRLMSVWLYNLWANNVRVHTCVLVPSWGTLHCDGVKCNQLQYVHRDRQVPLYRFAPISASVSGSLVVTRGHSIQNDRLYDPPLI